MLIWMWIGGSGGACGVGVGGGGGGWCLNLIKCSALATNKLSKCQI